MRDAAKQLLDDAIEAALSKQRHDFLNHLQVVYAYVQIGKADRALQYMDELADEMKNKSLDRKSRDESIHE